MPKLAIVAALEREVSGLTKGWKRVEREHQGHRFIFFEQDEMVVVCAGIGVESARRAAEAAIALYNPTLVQSVGFAGALDASLRVGDIVTPAFLIDARDGSRTEIAGGDPQITLVTFMAVAGVDQKKKLAQAYGAKAVDMEAAAVAAAARARGIKFGTTKAISDQLEFSMPHMNRFIDARGRFKTGSFAGFIILRPWLWTRVAQLAANSRKAEKTLAEHLQREHLKAFEQNLNQSTPPSSETPAAATSAGGRK